MQKNYLKYALAIGLKLFGLLLVVNVGFETISYWQEFFVGNQIEQAIMMMGGLIVFLTVVWTIPGILASLVGSNTPSSADNLIKGASFATSLGRTGVMLALASRKMAVQGSGVLSAGKAAVAMSRTLGNKGFMGIAKGAAGNMASAVKGHAASSFRSSAAGTLGGKVAERMSRQNQY